jgi:hypothetical protein
MVKYILKPSEHINDVQYTFAIGSDPNRTIFITIHDKKKVHKKEEILHIENTEEELELLRNSFRMQNNNNIEQVQSIREPKKEPKKERTKKCKIKEDIFIN